VFSGEIVEGFQPISVKAHMAKLFAGKPVVLKRTADKKEAAKYGSALKWIGADFKVKVVKAPVTESAPPQPTTTAQPTGRTGSADSAYNSENAEGFSLRPNEGDIFDPEPETESPELDLSSIQLARDDDAFLIEPTEETVVFLDLTSYEVAEVDDTPLAETTPEVKRVEAPDFGLDEPGAVFEALQEEKELLNPDTSAMTFAMSGSDLVDPDELKEAAPPPPDTSKINLVPNFD